MTTRIKSFYKEAEKRGIQNGYWLCPRCGEENHTSYKHCKECRHKPDWREEA